MKKEVYESPEMEVITMESADIIVTSGDNDEGDVG